MVDFADTPEEAAFRAEVRGFIEREYEPLREAIASDARTAADPFELTPSLRKWFHTLSERGCVAPAWPKEYGGASLSIKQQFLFSEEMAESRAVRPGGIAIGMAGPTIIAIGTEEQKQMFLPGILSGEVIWCQGYSEPGAGSDLASLQTRAVRDGDDWVINGQKIWTSGAHRADWMILPPGPIRMRPNTKASRTSSPTCTLPVSACARFTTWRHRMSSTKCSLKTCASPPATSWGGQSRLVRGGDHPGLRAQQHWLCRGHAAGCRRHHSLRARTSGRRSVYPAA